MIFKHKGMKFDACGVQDGNKWMACIYRLADGSELASRGLIIHEPHVTNPNGPPVFFDSEQDAIAAAQALIIQDFLRE